MGSLFKKECPFCHEQVWRWDFGYHCQVHTRIGPDGQQQDHITVPKRGQYSGSLDGIPQVYHHPKCDGCTGMPEDIIRSYLVKPKMYNSQTFCTGCRAYVHQRELYWTETGQRLDEYFRELAKYGPRRF